MSDISSSSSSTPHRTPRIRRCRKTNSKIRTGSGRKAQAKRFSSCGVVRMPSKSIPKPSLSSPEDLEVDSILQSSSSDDERDVSSSISSDDDEEVKNNRSSIEFRSHGNQKNGDYSNKESKNINSIAIRIANRNMGSNSSKVSEESPSRVTSNYRMDNIKNGVIKGYSIAKLQKTNIVNSNNRLSSESSISSSSVTKISNLERLIRTHPLWFQPDLNREDTTILLQGKEDGTFIVRKSSQTNTMALSVRLPKHLDCDNQKPLKPTNTAVKNDQNLGDEECSDFVQHYLIQQHQPDIPLNEFADSKEVLNQNVERRDIIKPKLKMKLESSHNSFDNILSLVYHYLTLREELPVLLTLPRILKEAESRQALSSLALLGKDFWRYPMSFFHSEKANGGLQKIEPESSNIPMHDQSSLSNKRCDEKEIVERNDVKQLQNNSNSKTVKIEIQESVPLQDSQEISSLLDDTILGLEEVGDLLQASLKEIENEKVISDNPIDSKTRPISKILQENDIFLHSINREKTHPNSSLNLSHANEIQNSNELNEQLSKSNNSKQILSNSRFPISNQQVVFTPSPTKSSYNRVIIANEVNSTSIPVPTSSPSSPSIPPAPPIRTVASRQSSPALSPKIDRKPIIENARSGPPTAAAALLDEIRNSVTSPTPLVLPTDAIRSTNVHSQSIRVLESCQNVQNSLPLSQSTNLGNVRKLSARQSFNKTSLKIVQDCKHPQSTSPTPTTSPTISPLPQSGIGQYPFQNSNRLSQDCSSNGFMGYRKHSSPPVLLSSASSSISPNRYFDNGIPESYCRSSILDKMSDYEDIWNDTLPTSKNSLSRPDRSMTPAESEHQFKAYLASKLLSTPSNSPSINNMSTNSFDGEKSRSISSSRSSTNTNRSNCSNTSDASSVSSTTISHSSPHSSTRADMNNFKNSENSQVSPNLVKQSPSISSRHRFNQCTNISNHDSKTKTRNMQLTKQSQNKLPNIEPSFHPKLSPKLPHATFCINETTSTITSSTSSSITSCENAGKKVTELKKSSQEEDPLYSDPLDALEKETDTRIYHSPAFNDHEDPIENVYEEAPNDKWRTENMPLQPLIESDHESSDSSSDLTSFSSSISSIAKEKYHNRTNKVSNRRRKSSLDNSLTNLSQFGKLFTDDSSSNGLIQGKEKSETVCSENDFRKHKNNNKSHSLSMEDLNQASNANEIGYPLSQVRKTSVSSYDEKCSKKRRKSSIKSISLKRREKTTSVIQNGTRNSNRLSTVIGKYIRPASVVNQLEVPKSNTWQLDSSSWEFLGQEDSKGASQNAGVDPIVSIHLNPVQTHIKTSPGKEILELQPTARSELLCGQSIENEGSNIVNGEFEPIIEVAIKSKKDQEDFSNSSLTQIDPLMTSKNREATSSPYDNLFLETQTSKQQLNPNHKNENNSVLAENQRNDRHSSFAFMNYGPNNSIERSQNQNLNDDDYTSDDSVYQSEENNSSAGSISPANQDDIIRNGRIPINNKGKQRKRKNKIEHPNAKTDNKPRIEVAVRRSTASIMDFRSTHNSQSPKRSNNVCPIHDESDFIDFQLTNSQSGVSSPSSTLSSQHINLSKKRIQDYIRLLNKSSFSANDHSNEGSEMQQNIDKAEENQEEALKDNGLLLQVIDNFVSCTIASINRRIKELKKSNGNKAINQYRNNVESTYETNEDNIPNSETFEVMKNVRQFISGVKNYLIKTGEGNLHNIMQEERSKLQWDECLNLDSILEEVLQQLTIPSLRASIVELCQAEQSNIAECDAMKRNESGQIDLFEELESVLTSFLPTHLQVFLSNYNCKEKDAFSNTIQEIERFVHLEKPSDKFDPKLSASPLEEITFLPNIVDSILKEIKLHHKMFYTKDSLKNETHFLLSKSKNTKDEKIEENPQMEKDSKTTKANNSQHNECSCTMENLSIDNFCVLLAIVIVKATLKRAKNLSEDEQKSVSSDLFLKYLDIETELMWHINPKSMMRSEQSFILSLFSTSCSLVYTLIQPVQHEGSITNDTSLIKDNVKKELNEMVKEDTLINKEFLHLSSDSEASTSSSEAKTSNILISCVGRRSKRKKKKKTTRKHESNEMNSKEKDGTIKFECNPMKANDINEKFNDEKTNIMTHCEDKVTDLSQLASLKRGDDNLCGQQMLLNDNQKCLGLKVASDVKLVFVRVLIPNEHSGTIAASSIPIINKCQNLNMGTRVRDIMSVVSFKQKVTNPLEYAVYLLTFESKDEMLKNAEDNTICEDVFHERQLFDFELVIDVLWPLKSTESALITGEKNCDSKSELKEDDKAFTETQRSTLNSNFLVYKRKDAKIAWPSAVSLLCNE